MTEAARRTRLFLSSYSLMFVILAIRFNTPWLRVTCAIIAAAGLLDTVWIMYVTARKTGSEPIRVSSVVDHGAEVSGYLATYLLPFLTVGEPRVRDLVAYAVFFLVLGLIYVRSGMVQINPTLYLFGRRVIHVVTDADWRGHIVAKSSSVVPGAVLHVATLNGEVRVEARNKKAGRT
jgi:hypothetical protein